AAPGAEDAAVGVRPDARDRAEQRRRAARSRAYEGGVPAGRNADTDVLGDNALVVADTQMLNLDRSRVGLGRHLGRLDRIECIRCGHALFRYSEARSQIKYAPPTLTVTMPTGNPSCWATTSEARSITAPTRAEGRSKRPLPPTRRRAICGAARAMNEIGPAAAVTSAVRATPT